MSLKDLDVYILTKIVTQQVDQVTCMECCKYYIAPETARCGHALCHACWSGRRSCPVCSASVERRTLKPNLPLQMLTDHIHSLGDAFEKLFNIKLDEFILECQQESESDTNKNVKQWLASSENQFSASITLPQSQASCQDSMPAVQLASSKIQVHTDTIKTTNAAKVVHKVQPQDDWDKIEALPDTEEIDLRDKNKENITGPMDLEPFVFEDEYSTDNPRRSSRKRVNNVEIVTKELETNNYKNTTVDSEKKSTKLQQNWGNVKKMRKEFSKLNKKNRSKLNVSIEMVKKTQKSNNKPSPPSPHIESQAPVYVIEDNTPTVCETQEYAKQKVENHIIHETDTNGKERTEKTENNTAPQNKTSLRNNTEIPEIRSQVFKSLKDEHQKMDVSKSSSNAIVMPFIKKGALCADTSPKLPQEVVPSKSADINQPVTVNTDDIEITIKTGNTITNIVINKKKNDVQLKVNTDREIQTSLGPQYLQNKESKSCSTSTEAPMQNLQINIGSNTFTQSKTATESAEKEKETIIIGSKSASTKVTKDTASADTATVQFEITESVEREISNIMEYVENEENPGHEPKTASIKSKENALNPEDKQPSVKDTEPMDVQDNVANEENNSNDIEGLNEQDIFASGSVKELPIQKLKATKHTPSEIFISKPRTQRQEKRGRKATKEDTQSRKKHKSSQEMQRNKSISKDTTLPDSEGMNYDAVMGKVFASIDADIEVIQKSQNTVKNTQVIESTQKANKSGTHETQKPLSTQNSSKKLNLSRTAGKANNNDEYSENLFTILDKDSEPQVTKSRTGSKKDPGPETQRNIDNLLTPGLCDNFESMQDKVIIADDDIEAVVATPVVEEGHDDDIVEETPQKSLSYTKKNVQKPDNSNPKPTSIVQPQKTKSDVHKLARKHSKKTLSVINLTDSEVESKVNNDTRVIDNKKKSTLETPLTINKFFDDITHKSTPVARKSLNFENDSAVEDSERTLCPTSSQLVKNTQEQEFMINAFEKTQKSPANKVLPMTNKNKPAKYCLAGSCLSSTETARLKMLCSERKWTHADKYTRDLTHLVVGVDEEKKAQRSVKYMCALAASKWIVSFGWVEQCLHTQQVVDEEPFEVLDMTGSNGPSRSRLAPRKLFHGITFYCMAPFSVVKVDDLKEMLQAAGGQVVSDPRNVKVTGAQPALLLAEPEQTQEDKFIYLAMELGIVPVNFEWVLNSLGDYCLHSIFELLLCPAALLPKYIEQWPAELIAKDFDSLTEK